MPLDIIEIAVSCGIRTKDALDVIPGHNVYGDLRTLVIVPQDSDFSPYSTKIQ